VLRGLAFGLDVAFRFVVALVFDFADAFGFAATLVFVVALTFGVADAAGFAAAFRFSGALAFAFAAAFGFASAVAFGLAAAFGFAAFGLRLAPSRALAAMLLSVLLDLGLFRTFEAFFATRLLVGTVHPPVEVGA
jgi:hypothetical protein